MDDPNMHAYGDDGPDDAEIGRQWREDSSLEKWFPITAERLAALERENLHLAREARTWWEAAQTYAAELARLRAALHRQRNRSSEMTDYQIMCQHLPTNHTKTETPFEADARYQVRELTMRGEKAAYAANPYGTFTVFKWA